MGNRLDSTQKAFDQVRGTRKRALERPLDKIEELRQQRRLPVEAMGDVEGVPMDESESDSTAVR